jgi:hypothetical protein
MVTEKSHKAWKARRASRNKNTAHKKRIAAATAREEVTINHQLLLKPDHLNLLGGDVRKYIQKRFPSVYVGGCYGQFERDMEEKHKETYLAAKAGLDREYQRFHLSLRIPRKRSKALMRNLRCELLWIVVKEVRCVKMLMCEEDGSMIVVSSVGRDPEDIEAMKHDVGSLGLDEMAIMSDIEEEVENKVERMNESQHGEGDESELGDKEESVREEIEDEVEDEEDEKAGVMQEKFTLVIRTKH